MGGVVLKIQCLAWQTPRGRSHPLRVSPDAGGANAVAIRNQIVSGGGQAARFHPNAAGCGMGGFGSKIAAMVTLRQVGITVGVLFGVFLLWTLVVGPLIINLVHGH